MTMTAALSGVAQPVALSPEEISQRYPNLWGVTLNPYQIEVRHRLPVVEGPQSLLPLRSEPFRVVLTRLVDREVGDADLTSMGGETSPSAQAKPVTVLVAQLVSYNGKVVESQAFSKGSEWRDGLGMLAKFNNGIRLCPGLGGDLDSIRTPPTTLLFDNFNRELYVRSFDCAYAVFDAKMEKCKSCQRLDERVSPHLRRPSATQDHAKSWRGPVRVIDVSNSALIRDVIADHSRTRFQHLHLNDTARSIQTLDRIVRSGNVCLQNVRDDSLVLDQRPSCPPLNELSVDSALTTVPDFKEEPLDGEVSYPSVIECQVSPDSATKVKTLDHPRKKERERPRGRRQQQANRSSKVSPNTTVNSNDDKTPVTRQCQVCLFKHHKAHIFEKHCETHVQRYDLNSPVTCPICHETFATKYELNPHYQRVHDRENGCCVECLEIVEWQKLRRHLTYVHYILPKNKLCPHCGKAFKNQQDLEVHITVEHEKKAENCICDHCGRIFPHPKLLTKHIQGSHGHPNKGLFRCPFCEKVFSRSHAWHKHVKIHSKHKPWRCGWCEYRSVNRFNVRLHMRKRHKEDASYDDIVKDGSFDFGAEEKLAMEAFKID